MVAVSITSLIHVIYGDVKITEYCSKKKKKKITLTFIRIILVINAVTSFRSSEIKLLVGQEHRAIHQPSTYIPFYLRRLTLLQDVNNLLYIDPSKELFLSNSATYN